MNGSKRQPLKTGKENQNVSNETAQQRIERLEALVVSQAATVSHLQGIINEQQQATNEYQQTINKLNNNIKQLKEKLAGEHENSGIDGDPSNSPPLITK